VSVNQTQLPGPLSAASRIGFLGDSHGDARYVTAAAAIFREAGVDTLVVLGDFGFLWHQVQTHPSSLWRMGEHLVEQGQTLAFLDGNHENFDLLYEIPVEEDGTRWVAPGIMHLPRGYRTTLSSGKSLAVLGGANSIDFRHRQPGASWWAEESITQEDLATLGHEHADVMIGHDAPLGVPLLERRLAETAKYWSAEGRNYSEIGRQVFHQGFLQVRPQLYFGGHYHHHVDQRVRFGDGAATFETRVVILDCNGGKDPDTLAILNVETLEIVYPDPFNEAGS
jgi:predicted phosphodiesterase